MDFISKESSFAKLHLVPLKILKIIVKQAYLYNYRYSLSFDWKELFFYGSIAGLSLKLSEFELCCQALSSLIAWLSKNNPQNEGKFTFRNILATHSSIEEEELNELENDYEEYLKNYNEKGILQIGLQLVDIEWKAGISVATDTSNNLNIPFVCLLLKFVNPQTGLGYNTSFSLDYQSFIGFLRDVRKINGLLATYN